MARRRSRKAPPGQLEFDLWGLAEQTADEQILKGGTAFITDLGMTGPTDSVLGVASEEVIERFLTGLPVRFRPGEGPVALCGALIEADPETGRACSIERVCLQ